jgi:hypothetical protein
MEWTVVVCGTGDRLDREEEEGIAKCSTSHRKATELVGGPMSISKSILDDRLSRSSQNIYIYGPLAGLADMFMPCQVSAFRGTEYYCITYSTYPESRILLGWTIAHLESMTQAACGDCSSPRSPAVMVARAYRSHRLLKSGEPHVKGRRTNTPGQVASFDGPPWPGNGARARTVRYMQHFASESHGGMTNSLPFSPQSAVGSVHRS